MTTFRNGYHFVPRKPKTETPNGRKLPTTPTEFGLRPGHENEGHAIYAPDTTSGRINCTVTLECPTIIGAARESGVKDQKPATVAPFLFGGRPAIPASSLKGMLSLVAESASQAPYRILRDMNLTVAYSEGNPRLTIRHQSLDGKSSTNRPRPNRPTQMKGSRSYFDTSLHPLGINAQGLSRSYVNPVESMFGFVAEAESGLSNAGRGTVNAVAGKLRISNARPSGDYATAKTTDFFLAGDLPTAFDRVPKGVKLTLLKEQGEPMKKPKRQEAHKEKAQFSNSDYDKLNSATPNFYFFEKEAPDQFIAKQDFATSPPDRYAAQGAKFYLHKSGTQSHEPWKSTASPNFRKGIDRKAAAPLLKPGVTFDFHIDFDNLTPHELNILCFALRPSERFRHKIGLGKGLGLGSLRIDVTGVVTIDRKARYTATAIFEDDPRSSTAPQGNTDMAADYAKNHSEWLDKNDKGAKTALLAIGETHNFDGKMPDLVPVLSVPLTENQYSDTRGSEDKSFQWFSDNDKTLKQKLRPIKTRDIPTLTTDSRQASNHRQGGPSAKPHQNKPPQLDSRPGSNGKRAASGVGTLAWNKDRSAGGDSALIKDDASGEILYANPHVLIRSRLTAADGNTNVRFTLDPNQGQGRPYRQVLSVSRVVGTQNRG